MAIDSEISETFEKANVQKEECRGRWAKYICGGGCHATALQFNKNILKPECRLRIDETSYKTGCLDLLVSLV